MGGSTTRRKARCGGGRVERRPWVGGAPAARLEINGLFMHVATQMGEVLRRTAQSVNIRERLDFSCAVFGRGRAADRECAAHARISARWASPCAHCSSRAAGACTRATPGWSTAPARRHAPRT
ncbi:MAG: hydantoinase B/oxoprolinase family protein [Steroidobacteraceae bacterium]